MDLVRPVIAALAIGTLVSLTPGCKDGEHVTVDASAVKAAVDHAPRGVAGYTAPTWQRYGDLLF